MNAFERILDKLDGARRNGTGVMARCPAHEDRDPSLALRQIEGQVLVHCHAGCHIEDVVAAAGLTMRDLFDEPRGATYTYADGRAVYRSPDKRFRQSGNTSRGRSGAAALYRLDQVKAAVAAGQPIWVVEGEKDVHALESIGAVATCSPEGAGKAHKADWTPLTGAAVLIVADQDAQGCKHARDVRAILGRLDAKAAICAPKVGKDAADHVAAGHRLDQFMPVTESEPSAEEEPWPTPHPLADEVPPFPIEALPSDLGVFVAATAEELQVPADLPALGVLSILSACSAGRHVVEVRPGWTEQVTLWTAAVLGSGERKSPTLKACAAPLYDLERQLIAEAAAVLAEQRMLYDIAEDRVAKARREAVSGKGTDADAVAAAQAFAEMTEPVAPVLLADDITAEALGVRMAEQGGRLAVISAEGGIFATLAGRYSNGVSNLDLALKAFSGELAKVDRVGRTPLVIDRPALTFGLAVQPEVMRSLAEVKALRGRGFLARFLYAVPPPSIGRRKIEPDSAPDAVIAGYARRVVAFGRTSHRLAEPVTLKLHSEAASALRDFRTQLEPRMHPDTGDLGRLADWASKLPGALVRVAALLTLVQDPATTVVTGESMRSAVALADYLAGHARVALAMAAGRSGHDTPAGRVLDWLRREGKATFTIRDAHRALQGQAWVETAADVEVAVNWLAEWGWVRELPTKSRSGPGRPPSPTFTVHPQIASTKSTESGAGEPDNNSVNSVTASAGAQSAPTGRCVSCPNLTDQQTAEGYWHCPDCRKDPA